MLSDKDIERIEAEERVRAEVRARADVEARLTKKAQDDATTRKLSIGCGTVIALIAVATLVSSLSGGSKPEREHPGGIESNMLEVRCEQLVREQLVSPVTARFEGAQDLEGQMTVTSAGKTWRSRVDSQNAFGAMVRTPFECAYSKATDTIRVQMVPR